MTTPRQPNILLVTTDQQRYDTIAPYAPPFLRTPHLDLLRHQGVRFDRAYAETPICVPSRVSLLTGQSPFRHGITANGSSSAVAGRTGTLPARLHDLGYATCAVGKMHFTPERARHGFDEMLLPADYYRAMAESGSPLQPMRHGLGQNELHPGASTVPEAMTLTSWIAEQSVRYIRDRRDPTCPFFLWTSFSKPHPPLDPPEPYASMYLHDEMPEPTTAAWSSGDAGPEAFLRQRQRGGYDLLSPEIVAAARRAYYGLVTHVDYALGRVLAALQDVDLLRDTTILFTSDHGEFLGDHRCGNKVTFHDVSARVPLLYRPARGDDTVEAGGVSDALVTHTDVAATVLAAAGGAVPDDWDGTDLDALARGTATPRERLLGIAHDRAQDPDAPAEPPIHLSIVRDRWKYLWYPEGPSEQLFDLTADPAERDDLARRDPGRAAELRTELVEELVRRGSLRSRRRQPTPWTADGALVRRPPLGDTERERRAAGWPGLHTETFGVDVRH